MAKDSSKEIDFKNLPPLRHEETTNPKDQNIPPNKESSFVWKKG